MSSRSGVRDGIGQTKDLTVDHPDGARPLAGRAVLLAAGRSVDGVVWRLAVVLATAVLAMVALAPPASAHAALSSTAPADGDVLASAPDVVSFTFNEAVSATSGALRVFDGDGTRVDDGVQDQPSPEQVSVGLRDVSDGGYLATYLVTSADGHVVRGATTFQVGAGAAVDDATAAALFAGGEGTVGIVATAIRGVDLGAALVAVGALVAGAALVVTARQRRIALATADLAARVGVVAALVTVPVQAMAASGLGAAALVSGAVLGDAVTSTVGVGALTRVVGLVLVLATVRLVRAAAASSAATSDRAGPARRPVAVGVAGAATLTLGSLLLDGHTRTVEPAAVMLLGDAVHVAAAAIWAGGLVVLARVLWSSDQTTREATDRDLAATTSDPRVSDRVSDPMSAGAAGPGRSGAAGAPGTSTGTGVMVDRGGTGSDRPRMVPDDDAAATATLLARWSGLALWSMLALVAAGSAMSWALVREPRALVTTDQGWALLVKVGLVAVVLVVAAWNHWRLVPAVVAHGPDEEAARQQLRGSVRLEVVLLALVLVATSVLVTLRPAAAEAGISGAFDTVVALADDTDLNLVVDPNRAGANQVHVYVLDETGRPVGDVEGVTMELVQVAEDVGPLRRTPRPSGPGHWILSGSELAIPGPWEITTIVGIDEFTEERATVEVVVNPS